MIEQLAWLQRILGEEILREVGIGILVVMELFNILMRVVVT